MDNKHLIEPLLQFEEGFFYFVQILRRKKDGFGPDRVISSYYVSSKEQLDDLYPEMKLLADFYNARVYINLTPRSLKQTALRAFADIANHMVNENYKAVKRAYNSACGQGKSKYWIIDVDTKEDVSLNLLEALRETNPKGGKLVKVIPTPNGSHLIVDPFDASSINIPWDLHKNNPTLLYYTQP